MVILVHFLTLSTISHTLWRVDTQRTNPLSIYRATSVPYLSIAQKKSLKFASCWVIFLSSFGGHILLAHAVPTIPMLISQSFPITFGK
eukprot:8843357-Ditylum_brightwellii.AAC.1